MGLYFSTEEFKKREARLIEKMTIDKLDAVVLFSQESLYWLTGFDTFGFCFFQCLIVKANGEKVLLTRLPDLRQAQETSTIKNIVIWRDRENANPAFDLRNLLNDMELLGCRIGLEYRSYGLDGASCRLVDEQLTSFAKIVDISGLIDHLRLIKSQEEITYIKKAAQLSDDALDAALPKIQAGSDEGDILAAMISANFIGGGDFPANDYIIGSGKDALLCRSKTGRRKLDDNDQLTLEWAGAYRHYHAPMLRTILIGTPTPRHHQLYDAAFEAILAIQTAMKPGAIFSGIFDTFTAVMEKHDLTRHRLSSCGYSIGARFAPTWMEMEHFEAESPFEIAPDMTLFAHAMLFDSDSGTAMTLGASYLIDEEGAKPLSRHTLNPILR